MTSLKWTCLPVTSVPVLVLLQVQVLILPVFVSAARSDRNIASEEYVGATVNATVLDGRGHTVHTMSSDDGTYGQNSPKVDTRGIVIAPAPHHGVVDRQGCDPNTRFLAPPRSVHWVALLQRGNCTFKEKILKAAAYNATAVLIYNNSTDKTVKMGHEGTGDTVAVMITEAYGKEILAHLERNLTVLVSLVVGQRSPSKNINRGSLRRLGDAAKKAIGKLTTRTVKKGDKETDPDFNHCAVCIESYQLNDVVRILPCNMVLDVERLGVSQASGSQRALLGDNSQPSISLEPLSPPHPEATPRTPADITIAVTSGGHFFNRNSMSPRSVVCEMELPDIQASLDLYDDNKS
ncbi:hypothetical protein INR49_020588 [Caranx melampygus]|nr:hypothetical protein INR49_020588 [Caranx melampygus]